MTGRPRLNLSDEERKAKRAEYMKTYYKKNKERLNTYSKEYYNKNAEHLREYNRQLYRKSKKDKNDEFLGEEPTKEEKI